MSYFNRAPLKEELLVHGLLGINSLFKVEWLWIRLCSKLTKIWSELGAKRKLEIVIINLRLSGKPLTTLLKTTTTTKLLFSMSTMIYLPGQLITKLALQKEFPLDNYFPVLPIKWVNNRADFPGQETWILSCSVCPQFVSDDGWIHCKTSLWLVISILFSLSFLDLNICVFMVMLCKDIIHIQSRAI